MASVKWVRGVFDRDLASMLTIVVGVMVIGAILMVMARVERGLLGVVLAGLAAVVLIYWLREVLKMVRREMAVRPVPKMEWSYDMIRSGGEVTVVAEVPGPEKEVKVSLSGRTLEIRGGDGFRKSLEMDVEAEVVDVSYINGVLNVKLRDRRAEGLSN